MSCSTPCCNTFCKATPPAIMLEPLFDVRANIPESCQALPSSSVPKPSATALTQKCMYQSQIGNGVLAPFSPKQRNSSCIWPRKEGCVH